MLAIRRVLVALFWCAAIAACGGGEGDTSGTMVPGASCPARSVDAPPETADILDRLRALPHVLSVGERGTQLQGYRYFAIGFDQPVDHDDPEGQHFTQFITLIHRDEHAPFILGTTGYANYYFDVPMEPTLLLAANQIVVDHRYFLPSRPDPTDWSLLRVVQAAADHHEIEQSFCQVYDGPWISTGGSKGGMTSIYHRHLYPDDVVGTVAYSAPYNRDAGDTRYDGWFDDVLPADCLERVRDAQVDFLANRRQAMVDRATADAELRGIQYTRVAIPAAVESAIAGAEWSFFQYTGVAGCDQIPDPSASDDVAWDWLRAVSDPDILSDPELAFFEPYYYQAYAELGYPDNSEPHLDGLLQFGPDDYAGTDPPELPPTYDPAAVDAAAAWVQTDAAEVIFVYGEYDPWTAGAFDVGSNRAVDRYTVAAGTHGSELRDLSETDQEAAFATLEAWTGVTPAASLLRSLRLAPPPREPHLPVHALQMARRRARRQGLARHQVSGGEFSPSAGPPRGRPPRPEIAVGRPRS